MRVFFALALAFFVWGCGSKDNSPSAPPTNSNLSINATPVGSSVVVVPFADPVAGLAVPTVQLTSGTGPNNVVEISLSDLPASTLLADLHSIAYRFYLKERMHDALTAPSLRIALDLDHNGVQDDVVVLEPQHSSGFTVHTAAGLLRQARPFAAIPLNSGIFVFVDPDGANDLFYGTGTLALPGSTAPVGSRTVVRARMGNLTRIAEAFSGAVALRISVAVGATADTNLQQKTGNIQRFDVRLKNGTVRSLRF